MTTKPPHRSHYAWWLLLLIAVWLGYDYWRSSDELSAKEEAVALGWSVEYNARTRRHWRNANGRSWDFTTFNRVTAVGIPTGEGYEQNHHLIQRLNPTALSISSAQAMHDLSAIKDLSRLERLYVKDGTSLSNVDALQNLSSLKEVSLDGSTSLKNVDGLKKLPVLKKVWLRGCTSLTNVDVLRSLPSLEVADFYLSTGLSKESIAALKAALPNAGISGP